MIVVEEVVQKAEVVMEEEVEVEVEEVLQEEVVAQFQRASTRGGSTLTTSR